MDNTIEGDSCLIVKYIQCLEKLLIPTRENFPLKNLKDPPSTFPIQREIIEEIEELLIEFREIFPHLAVKPISETMTTLSNILGYGLGSTPESDDILLGILTTIYSLNSDISKEFEVLAQFPFERFTSQKSAQLFHRILHNNFPHELQPFIRLLKDQSHEHNAISRFEQEARKIRMMGASSGHHFLLGVLWELQFHKEHLNSND